MSSQPNKSKKVSAKLSTPVAPTSAIRSKNGVLSSGGSAYDGIITGEQWLDHPFVIVAAEKVPSRFASEAGKKKSANGLPTSDHAYLLTGNAPTKKGAIVLLCGATVLVGTIDAYLAEGGKWPQQVTAIKPKGKGYFVFA